MNFTSSQYYKKKTIIILLHGNPAKVVCIISIYDVVFVCHTAWYSSFSHFTVFKLLNNETDALLEYSDMFCDALLTYSVVILYELTVSFQFLSSGLVIGLSIHFFIKNYGFYRIAITFF